MFDFRPDAGWHLVYGHFGTSMDQIVTQTMPIAGWLQDMNLTWRPAVLDITADCDEANAQFVREFMEPIRQEHVQVLAFLVPPDRSPEAVVQIIRDTLNGMD